MDIEALRRITKQSQVRNSEAELRRIEKEKLEKQRSDEAWVANIILGIEIKAMEAASKGENKLLVISMGARDQGDIIHREEINWTVLKKIEGYCKESGFETYISENPLKVERENFPRAQLYISW